MSSISFALTVEHGAPARREVDITWADDSPRSITGLTPVCTVYTGPSDSMAPLFTPVSGSVDPDVASRAVFQFSDTDTAQPKASYYATIDLLDSGGNITVDGRWHGAFKVSGR